MKIDNINLSKVSLGTTIANILRREIMLGILEEGEHLIETALSSRFQTSRGPIREAVSKLEQEGLLIRKRNQLFVYKTSKKDLIHVFECRATIESLAAELAAERISEDNKARLLKIINEKNTLLFNQDGNKQINEPDIANQFTLLCSEFHNIILEESRNPWLIQLVNQLRLISTFYKYLKLRSSNRRESIFYEHQQIADAICAHDQDTAKILMKKHLVKDLNTLLKQF